MQPFHGYFTLTLRHYRPEYTNMDLALIEIL